MHAYRRHCRFASWLIVLWIGGAHAVFAHGGHDHGPAGKTVVQAAEPRFTAAGTRLTLVGILKSGRLWLYADDADTNAPLHGLNIEIDNNGTVATATPSGSAGSYVLDAGTLQTPGVHPVVITVTGAGHAELLTANLTVPVMPAMANHSVSAATWNYTVPILIGGGLLLYAAWRKSRSSTTGFAAAVTLGTIGLCSVILSGTYLLYATVSTAAAVADADAQSPAQPSDAARARPDTRAQRLPDGAAFLPKPAQTLLQVRTVTVHTQRLPRSVLLPGRVVHDPQSRVVVQAEQTGRLAPPPHGFILPGTPVKKGELLAYLQPVVSALDRARQQAELAALEKDLYLNRRQTERLLAQLGAQDSSASVALEVGRAEQAALQKRIDLLRGALADKLPMTAPVDGLIGEVNALNGAVVPAGAQIFSIVDPTRFRLQALATPDLDTQQIHSAHAVLSDGSSFPLAFAGHGFQLANQALPLQFRPLADMPPLLVGALFDIRLQTHESVEGLPVPRDALLSAPAGADAWVWVRTDAERFEPRRVETQSADEHSVLVVSGLQAGDRVVSRGAGLLAMIPD